MLCVVVVEVVFFALLPWCFLVFVVVDVVVCEESCAANVKPAEARASERPRTAEVIFFMVIAVSFRL